MFCNSLFYVKDRKRCSHSFGLVYLLLLFFLLLRSCTSVHIHHIIAWVTRVLNFRILLRQPLLTLADYWFIFMANWPFTVSLDTILDLMSYLAPSRCVFWFFRFIVPGISRLLSRHPWKSGPYNSPLSRCVQPSRKQEARILILKSWCIAIEIVLPWCDLLGNLT